MKTVRKKTLNGAVIYHGLIKYICGLKMLFFFVLLTFFDYLIPIKFLNNARREATYYFILSMHLFLSDSEIYFFSHRPLKTGSFFQKIINKNTFFKKSLKRII